MYSACLKYINNLSKYYIEEAIIKIWYLANFFNFKLQKYDLLFSAHEKCKEKYKKKLWQPPVTF